MGTHVDIIDKIKHISVMGEIDKKAGEYLCKVLKEDGSMEVHITFFDAGIVSMEVAQRLAFLQKTMSCKIYVLKGYLYSYFYGLGIKCTYVRKKKLVDESTNSNLYDKIQIEEDRILNFLDDISQKYGYDFKNYQLGSIARRIKITMLRNSCRDYEEFFRRVIEEQEAFEQLFLDLSINTTSFFRDADVFLFIRDNVLPYLNSFAHIKIWCAGCSNGKEPYSLAILLNEAGMLHKSQIYATDINPYVVEEAKNGLYSIGTIDDDINNYRKSGGVNNFTDYVETNSNYIKVKDFIKEKILFFQHSLIGNGILNEFHLIFCRNVFIYFNNELQKQVIKYFHNSLDISGFLVLGKSEGVLQNDGYKYFNRYSEENKIYRRKNVVNKE